MKSTMSVLAVVCSLIAVSSFAQNARSFVATTGNDANACTRGNECRTFTRALAVTNTGGEVVAIDSGGFSPFTASKAVTVIGAPGVVAAINGTVSVNATSTDRMVLRNLTINTPGPSQFSIYAANFSDLVIENCKLTGSVLIAGGASATVSDTTIIGTGSSAANIEALSHRARAVRRVCLEHLCGVDRRRRLRQLTSRIQLRIDDRRSTRDGLGIRAGGFASGATHVNVRLNNCNFNESQQYCIAIGNDTTVYSMGNNMISVAAGGFGDVNGTITPATKY